MAHETHHDAHAHHAPADARPTSSYRAAFWFVIILAGLFIAAINFVGVMSHDDGGHGGGHGTEAGAQHGQPAGHHEPEAKSGHDDIGPSHATGAQGEGASTDTAHTEAHH
jgi:hypothetical protein